MGGAERKHVFNAGPGALPRAVLEEVQRDLVDWQGRGLSIMEMSHRSSTYEAIIAEARQTIADLYALPADWDVLFLQGGASLQFAMVPMNLGSGGAYLNTGTWSTNALAEARRVGAAVELWSSAERGFDRVPGPDEVPATPDDAPYLHYTSNNTIYGTQYHHVPQSRAPLVCDMSSDFLSRPVDVAPYQLIYAGAQKNAGPSGVTIVLGPKALLHAYTGAASVPVILRYATHAKKDSMYNTPNTFGIYVVGLVAKWVRDAGGLAAMAARNAAKAEALYGALDAHPLVRGHAEPASRSQMNVTFRLETEDQEAAFLRLATARGMMGLKGHRSVGGLRASIYNAVEPASVDALVALLADFKG
ncbi:MAG: 3-phosphoserine/phosphohydroxythreonine transaminase [Myxococcales bacterium]|nr:3-phosphoserine/phosphohydroxythreonine transaminase [Myxococcales bacterium]